MRFALSKLGCTEGQNLQHAIAIQLNGHWPKKPGMHIKRQHWPGAADKQKAQIASGKQHLAVIGSKVNFFFPVGSSTELQKLSYKNCIQRVQLSC